MAHSTHRIHSFNSLCDPIVIVLLLLFTALLTPTRAAVIVESNVVYGTAVDYAGSNITLTLDAYYEAGPKTNRPAIILTHGGGFGAGDKGFTPAQGNFYPDIATAFATNGFAAFSINYRLWPGCPGGCPDEIDMAVKDVMTALTWIRAHADHFGIDVGKALIGGDSAGGALAINAAYRSAHSNSFQGCISLWGGLPPYGTDVHPVNDAPVTSQTPPTCLIHGTADIVVPYAVSVLLASNLTTAAIYNELHPLPSANHYPVMDGSGYKTNLVNAITDQMVAFAKRVLTPIQLGDPRIHSANGRFSFSITGPTNTAFAIEESTNQMQTWLSIATNHLISGGTQFTNDAATANRFYRARVLPP